MTQHIKTKTFLFVFFLSLVSSLFVLYVINSSFQTGLSNKLKLQYNTAVVSFHKQITHTQEHFKSLSKSLLQDKTLRKQILNQENSKLVTYLEKKLFEIQIQNQFVRSLRFDKKLQIIDQQSGFAIDDKTLYLLIRTPLSIKDEYLGALEICIDAATFVAHLENLLPLANIFGFNTQQSILKNLYFDPSKIIEKLPYIALSDSYGIQEIEKESYWVDTQITFLDFKKNKIASLVLIEDITTDIMQQQQLFIILFALIAGTNLLIIFILHRRFKKYLSHTNQISRIDTLTHLENKKAFEQDYKKHFKNALILLNINSFSSINKLFGIESGDEVLKEFASLLQSYTQGKGIKAYRISGDEFLLFTKLEQCDVKYHIRLLNKFQSLIKSHYFHLSLWDTQLDMDISAGVVYGLDASIEKASMAMKQARKERKLFVSYGDHTDSYKNHQSLLSIKDDIKQALQMENFLLYYQPVVDQNRDVILYESLVRMKKNQNNEEIIIPPKIFLEAAKTLNLYLDISQFVLNQSFDTAQKTNTPISFNITQEDIHQDGLQEYIFQKLSHFENAHLIIFEISLDKDSSNVVEIQKFIQNVQTLGAKIAIDEVGKDHLDLQTLLSLKPDIIKIENLLQPAILESLLLFARHMKIQTIIKSISTQEFFEEAKNANIDGFQGFYCGKPSPQIGVIYE